MKRALFALPLILAALLLPKANGATTFKVVAAGDICAKANPSSCQGSGALISKLGANVVLDLGDEQYDVGALTQFQGSYAKSPWGAAKSITQPVPGNHEWKTSNASGYSQYFGDPAPYYRTFVAGGVRFVGLDSTKATTSELSWLKGVLANNTQACVVGYWHHPLFTSGVNHGPATFMQPFWNVFAANGGDVILNGHNHQYERFQPINGMTEYVVGTGMNGSGYDFKSSPDPRSAYRSKGQGVLKLSFTSYSWSTVFVHPNGSTSDSNSGAC